MAQQLKTYNKGLIFQGSRAGLIVPYDNPADSITNKRIEAVIHRKLRGQLVFPLTKPNVVYNKSMGNDPIAEIFDNVPTEGIRIEQSWSRIDNHGYFEWKLIDPRGFHTSLSSYAIGQILKEFNVIGMVIQSKCVYGFNHTYLDTTLFKG